MIEKTYETSSGVIHYWTNDGDESSQRALIFLPGLTADHRLFEKQIEYFKDTYRVLVWDAPGHASSYPFCLDFTLFDLATWLDEIFVKERIENPILIGQSMGGYVGQVYAQLFPEKLKGLVTIDSPSMQRKYYTAMELWLSKNMEAIYRIYPWKSLLKSGPKSVSTTDYGRKLMYDMMMVYDGNQERYARLAGYGYKIFSEAVEKNLSYEVKCPQLVICGKEDRAGSCIRYLKAYERNTGKSVKWIDKAGHNSNTDQPDIVNRLIDEFLNNKIKEKLG
ncbi:alpha/beta fold hydrolase [Streptococcus sinensis]|uniref:Alpha/beta fold family hydrolase n=1 Tax=Streptococcus sinensis TaxID=176090 RepID=A0A0A0DFN7_9STRE|nr:alpha/beta hydrolase [Streptococcus sinensis]KGM36879.1 alpha/beta fold family hydrolase [Streptococcus sinensis]